MDASSTRAHLEALVLIGIGGMLGSNLRFVLGAIAGEALMMTLAVNAVGSFALGLLLWDVSAADLVSQRVRYVFGTGLLASFTTFSTFLAYILISEPTTAIVYIAGSYAAGFGAVVLSQHVVARVDRPWIKNGGT